MSESNQLLRKDGANSNERVNIVVFCFFFIEEEIDYTFFEPARVCELYDNIFITAEDGYQVIISVNKLRKPLSNKSFKYQ